MSSLSVSSSLRSRSSMETANSASGVQPRRDQKVVAVRGIFCGRRDVGSNRECGNHHGPPWRRGVGAVPPRTDRLLLPDARVGVRGRRRHAEHHARAWRALPRFDDQAGLRPWLYRIATNVCIDMLNGRSRRALPMDVARVGTSEGRLIDRRPGSAWIEPAPDSLVLPAAGDPAERVVARESVRLAFIAALQRLAPRQRAVLILRDVLHWRAAEVATLLESSTDSVNSSLRRARAALEPIDRDSTPNEPSDDHRALLDAYVDAFERQDVNALVALLREDAIVEMPPFELWLRGATDIRDWLVAHDALRDHLLVPVRANGAPAVAVTYRPRPEVRRPPSRSTSLMSSTAASAPSGPSSTPDCSRCSVCRWSTSRERSRSVREPSSSMTGTSPTRSLVGVPRRRNGRCPRTLPSGRADHFVST